MKIFSKKKNNLNNNNFILLKKVLWTFAILIFLSSIIVSLLILFWQINLQEYEKLKTFVINKFNFSYAKNWKYDLNFFFLNNGRFLSQHELFNRSFITIPNIPNLLIGVFENFDLNQQLNSQNIAIISNISNVVLVKEFISYFVQFNISLQLFVVFKILILFLLVIIFIIYLILFINAWKERNYFLFGSIQLLLFLNFIGFIIFIILWFFRNELNNKAKTNNFFIWCEKHPPLIWFFWFKNQWSQFPENNNLNSLIEIKNLKYTYNIRHNWWKHYKDIFLLLFKEKTFQESEHIYEKEKNIFLNKKKKNFINKIFKKTKFEILKGITLKIPNYSFTSIIGPNGCGKSTLIKTLVRINKYYLGSIFWNQKNLHKINARSFAQNVAYIPQNLEIPNKTNVYDFVAYGRLPYSKGFHTLTQEDHLIIDEALRLTNTVEFIHKDINELSGGQKQKVILAMILAQKTNTIILDEPTTYLDLENQYLLLDILKKMQKNKKTIITVLHDINQAITYSDHLIILKDGLLYAEGAPEKVVNKKMLNDVFEVDTTIIKVDKKSFITDVNIK